MNMHEFVAEENSCFFDICLPNYTADSLRRITYFKKNHSCEDAAEIEIDSRINEKDKIIRLQYDATPPVLPVDFKIKEVDYRGDY